ncbi:3-isopropylmalate dehydratase small subunit [Mesoterricola silvestris]|uniref:3-isopropylmalate dehydratase small subunit n=1 Tax=Mesoterricola silvestris TaxID=2927979 RepID=A0AA48HA06_9BACT|nr:3-isopropylmalate dehydratase small subunit [Mesoterricola silvestris]BDU74493.1 3-isopropylmalate dehydratase small subunit [Mesoterricola silvestris]
MTPFIRHSGVAAAFIRENIDTDLIIPKQFLTTILRSGLGRHLFHDLRYREDGSEDPDFVLNREPGRGASILLGGANFGCGSSREHAPWALLDFGFRAILAPSFADIFRTNAFKNGLLPAVVDPAVLGALAASSEPITVDLEALTLAQGGAVHPFTCEPWGRSALLEGLDEIETTLRRLPAIEAFEARRKRECAWL